MEIRITVIAVYFSGVLLLGHLARRRLGEGASEYFLAGRTLGGLVLIGTMAATNFSAFTVFGTSGAGYRAGLSFFPIMAFGTGFMALTFWLVGRQAWRLGREHGFVTPSELVHYLYRSKPLAAIMAAVLVVFTVPYVALQPMAAGEVVQQLFGLPQWVGATVVTGVLVLYTLRGGLRAVAWTDVFQGLLMISVMLLALGMVASHYGGWSTALAAALDNEPALFSRPGLGATYTPAIWFSFLALWFYCDPMFPQLFQRFYAARDERAVGRTMLFYPLICTIAFAPPVLIGVLGHLAAPGLSAKEADAILPLVMMSIGGDLVGTLVLAAGLAALMSTMDSQLLTLSSIFSRDLWPVFTRRQVTSVSASRVFVVVLALLGLVVALTTDATILELGVSAFTGLAALFPTVLFGLHLRQPRAPAAIASIVAGEAIVVASHLGALPAHGFLSAIPVMVSATVVYLVVHFLTGPVGLPAISSTHRGFILAFSAIFLLAMDFWRWNETGALVLGLPLWCWYFVGLSALQTVLTRLMLDKDRYLRSHAASRE